MKVLVTGGSGYIGSHTCVQLLQQGHEVVDPRQSLQQQAQRSAGD